MIHQIINRYDEYESIDLRNMDDFEQRKKLREQLFFHDLPWLIEYLRRSINENKENSNVSICDGNQEV